MKMKIRKLFCKYLKEQGEKADKGAPSFDLKAACWILDHFTKVRKPGKKKRDVGRVDDICVPDGMGPGVDSTGKIIDQRAFPDIPFGRKGNTAQHGCGWISAYNAKKLMGENVRPSEILREVEPGARSGGKRGLNPFYLVKYFQKNRYDVRVVTEGERMDSAAKESDAFIVCYIYKRSNYTLGGHFVSGRWDETENSFYILNGENGGTDYKKTIREIVSPNTLITILIGISKKASEDGNEPGTDGVKQGEACSAEE